jgi:hypothetical protein
LFVAIPGFLHILDSLLLPAFTLRLHAEVRQSFIMWFETLFLST